MPKQIYIFSGLGADERVFQRLDLSAYTPVFIKWQVPMRGEAIESYATRLLAQINTPKPILVGLSFGGIMAIEVARQIETAQIILISSAKTKREIPFYFRIAGVLGLHKLLPVSFLKKSNAVTDWFFGTSTSIDKQLLQQVLADTDPVFLKWAMAKIVGWTNEMEPKNVLHIHGTSDRILPCRFVKADLILKNGGHFMVFNKADELSNLLRNNILTL